MEKGPAPGQLLLSPSNRCESIIKSPVVKLKRTNQEVTVPDTPQRPSHEPTWQSQPQPEFVVPETQPQDLGDLRIASLGPDGQLLGQGLAEARLSRSRWPMEQ